MIKLILSFIFFVNLSFGGQGPQKKSINLTKSQVQRLSQYFGVYTGGFDTAYTLSPWDDLNNNPCFPKTKCDVHLNPLDNIALKLDLNDDNQVTLNFYETKVDLTNNVSLDFLGKFCNSKILNAQKIEIYKKTKQQDEIQKIFFAAFPMDGGRCSNSLRIRTDVPPQIYLTLYKNINTQHTYFELLIEKSVKDGNYLYVKRDGKKIPIEVDINNLPRDSKWGYRICSKNNQAIIDQNRRPQGAEHCAYSSREKWDLFLPVPFMMGAGGTYFWGSTRSPKWNRTTNEPPLITYHTGIFSPIIDE